MLVLGEGKGRLLPMTAQHVRALTDGQYFLGHLASLRALRLDPYCRICAALGLGDAVDVRQEDTQYVFRCAHTSGWVKRHTPLEVQPLLATLKWNLRCSACHQPLETDNSPIDATLLVTCPCTVRSMANPLATAATAS